MRPRRAIGRGEQAIRDFATSPWSIGVVAGLLWALRYVFAFGWPFRLLPPWAGWFDQSRYLRSAAALAQGDFAPAAHWYPAAYPLLAAPFARLLPLEPFFVPDLVLFALSCVAFTRAVRPLLQNAWIAASIFSASILILDNSALFWIEPWTTTLSATLIWWLVAAVVDLLFPRDPSRAAPSPRSMALAGALAGALPMVRPADALVSLCAALLVAIALYRARRLTLAGSGRVVLGGVATALPLVLLHLAINGLHPGGYVSAGSAQGFAFADLPWRAYVLLVTPKPWFPDGQSLVEGLPLLVPGAAGLIVIALSGTCTARRWIAMIMAIALPYALLYLAYTDLQPPGLWRYNNAHYFKWLFPLFGLGLWYWLGSFGRWRSAAIATTALVAMLLPGCFRLLPTPVPDDRPARMLMFRGSTTRLWADAYFASSVIADSRGALVNVGQFHQVPDRDGERAISVIRPFAAHPRLRDPGEPPPYDGWRAPYARYDVRLSFGLPCAFAPRACRMPPP
jgi:hypothetical protein